MKKLFICLTTLLVISCSQENTKEEEKSTKEPQVICDTIIESNFDSLGNEMLTKKWHCDTIKEKQ
ncbi:MAG: hypothetical protein J0L69_13555 [Bacteroidetes bacterium]|nr:hypothetical protein [Bacteroidota bacterium]